jgi:hypothetical protein
MGWVLAEEVAPSVTQAVLHLKCRLGMDFMPPSDWKAPGWFA